MSRLALERVVECGDSESLWYGIREETEWYDISNHSCVYELDKLISEGWEIVDVKVSVTSNCSSGGYRAKYDHTIVVLELREAYEDGFVGDYGVNC